MKNQKIVLTISILVFLMLYFFFGNLILQSIFISDPCYYHSHDEPLLIYILFDFPSSEGYHPVATKFGYLIFGFIGYFVGRFISKSKVHPNENK
jgi:hypothetical protein